MSQAWDTANWQDAFPDDMPMSGDTPGMMPEEVDMGSMMPDRMGPLTKDES